MIHYRTSRGRSVPLGVTTAHDGVNFVVLSRSATAVSLIVWPIEGDTPLGEFQLDPRKNRTGHHWHVRVSGLPALFRYGWRVDGPKNSPLYRYNPNLILIDPTCAALADGGRWGENKDHFQGIPSAGRGTHRRSLFHRKPFNWGDEGPLVIPLEDSIIYEVHVRGFTVHPSSGVKSPGTFAGL